MDALLIGVFAKGTAAGSRHLRSIIAWVGFTLCTVLASTLAVAQTPIQYGDCVRDTIVVAGDENVYEFQGNSGDVINIWMSNGGPFAWSRIELYDPIGGQIAVASDFTQARIDTLTLDATGQYTIIASEQDGDEAIIYGLYLQRTNSPGQATALSYGDCVQGTIVGLACGDTYTFAGTVGDVIDIWMSNGGAICQVTYRAL